MIDATKIDFVSAGAYLEKYPAMGRVFPLKQYGQTCYLLHDCICAGTCGQVIIPLRAQSGRTCIIEESFNYDHEHPTRMLAFGTAFSKDYDEESLDEAAPLFPVWGMSNLWHWLFNCLPKVQALESMGFRGQYIVNLSYDFIRESLELMGIGKHRLKHCDRKYYVNKLYTLGRMDGTLESIGLPLLSRVRESILERISPLPGSKRCYVKRVGQRKIIRENEEELLELLKKYDFEVMIPEEHSFTEQITFMTNSACTLAPHGANAALALFQKRKGILMESFGQKYVYYCNLPIAKLLKLLYIPICQDFVTGSMSYEASINNWHEDYVVDLKLLETILGNLKNGSYGL